MRNITNLLIFFLFLIIVPVDVYGELSDNNKHILAIESLEVVNSKMTFKGYSFISHMDNWGKNENDDYGNLMTYLIVYTKDGEQASNNIDTCIDGNQCEVVKTKIDWGDHNDPIYGDMFYSRCTGGGCKQKEDIELNRRDKGFINNDSCNDGNYSGTYDGKSYNVTDNECLYENVRFKVDVYIDTIVDTFIEEGFTFDYLNNNNLEANYIYFKILSKNVESGDFVVSTFNILQSVCTVGGNGCVANAEHTTGYFSFYLPTFANNAVMDANVSIPFKDTTSWDRLPDKNFKSGATFNINEFIVRKQKNKFIDGNFCGSYYDSFVGLNSKVDGSYVIPGTNNVYYAPVSHLKFEGSFAIDFKILREDLTCDSVKIDGASLSSRKDVSPKDISCGESAKYYDCITTGNSGNSISATIYYLDENPQVKSDVYYEIVQKDNDENEEQYFLPVTVKTDALIVQKAEFKFGNITPQIVRAGKGFSIENMYYENMVLFIISGRYNNPSDSVFYNSPFIFYEASRPIYSLVGGSQSVVIDTEFSINQKVREYYLERDGNGNPVSDSSPFYYKDKAGKFVRANSLEAAIMAISNSFFSSYDINYDNDVADDSKIEDIIEFKSCDSNSFDGDCRDNSDNVGGLWNLIDKGAAWKRVDKAKNLYQNDEAVSPYDNTKYRGFGVEYVSKYAYKLPYSYIALNDFSYNSKNLSYGDIIYNDVIIENENLYYVGNKYFVPLKYSGGSFPFNLVSNVNPSLINEMVWELNGTCSVDVENGLFDDGGKPLYKYRSISLSNPFPKGNTSLNWRKWHLISGNLDRLKNTYDYDPIYLVTLTKNFGVDGIEIDDINNCSSIGSNQSYGCSGSYGSFDGLSIEGISNFVDSYPWARSNQNSYCGLGLFSSRCDAFADGTILDIEGDIDVENGGSNEGVDTPIPSPVIPSQPSSSTS